MKLQNKSHCRIAENNGLFHGGFVLFVLIPVILNRDFFDSITICITFVLSLSITKLFNMKILDLLRSASPQATRIRVVAAILAIAFYCCNSEKQVLKNSDKTQHVVNKWLETHPARTDTLINTKPGDTITQLLIGYDTTLVKDTVTNVFTKVIYRTNTITRSIHDTTTVAIRDNRLLIACQNGLAASDYDAKQAKISADQFKLIADRWKLYFWILIAITVVVGLVLFKLK